MPLPLIIGAIAVAAGATGVAKGVSGAKKLKEANDDIKKLKNKFEDEVKHLKEQEKDTQEAMDELGKKEVVIMSSFEHFSDCIERIQNRPDFDKKYTDDKKIKPISIDKLKEVAIGAAALEGVIAGSALGTAGGFAAAGATSAAVSALGVASTGTAISGLSGAAATNATLAALGGGSLAAGGGGIALGTTILSGATLGIGLMVGGFLMNHVGEKAKEDYQETLSEYNKGHQKINEALELLSKIEEAADSYTELLNKVAGQYFYELSWLNELTQQKNNWYEYSLDEQNKIEHIVLLVSILYKMCGVQFLLKENDTMELNHEEIETARQYIDDSKVIQNDLYSDATNDFTLIVDSLYNLIHLKKEGEISEEEYNVKRVQIIDNPLKWSILSMPKALIAESYLIAESD